MKKIKSLILLYLFLFLTNSLMGQEFNRHELRLGINASGEIIKTITGNMDYVEPYYNYSNYYSGDRIYSPLLTLTYSYQFSPLFAAGVTFGYQKESQDIYDLYTENVINTSSDRTFYIIPTIRLDWYRSTLVKMYSGAGFGLVSRTSERYNFFYSQNESSSDYMTTFEMTFFGISVGRKLFGFCELGLSTFGLGRIGVGYRFNTKSSK